MVAITPQALQRACQISGDAGIQPFYLLPGMVHTLGYTASPKPAKIQAYDLSPDSDAEPQWQDMVITPVADELLHALFWLQVPAQPDIWLYKWCDPQGAARCDLLYSPLPEAQRQGPRVITESERRSLSRSELWRFIFRHNLPEGLALAVRRSFSGSSRTTRKISIALALANEAIVVNNNDLMAAQVRLVELAGLKTGRLPSILRQEGYKSVQRLNPNELHSLLCGASAALDWIARNPQP